MRRAPFGIAIVLALAAALPTCGPAEPEGDAPLRVERVIGEGGKNPGQFLYPRATDADAHSIWCVDKAGRVQRLDAATGEHLAGFTLERVDQGKPTGLTIAPLPDDPSRLGLWVAETHNFRIIVLDPDDMTGSTQPEPVFTVGSYGEEPGQFIYVTDVAVLTDDQGRVERIYIAEYGGNDRITILDGRGELIRVFGAFGVATPDRASEIVLNRPQSLEIDPVARELIVTDACNHRLGRFTLDGELLGWIGSPEEDLFRYPYGLVLLEDRQAMVAEFGGNRLALVDLDAGAVVRYMGVPGREAGELASPWGLAAIGDEIFVLDSGNNRVQVIDAPSRPISRYAATERNGGGS